MCIFWLIIWCFFFFPPLGSPTRARVLTARGLQCVGVSKCCCSREAPMLPKPWWKGEKFVLKPPFKKTRKDQGWCTAWDADSVCLPLQVMEFYCESCETAMCLECTEGEHREHVTVPLRDVVEQHKAALKTQLDAIRSRWAEVGSSQDSFWMMGYSDFIAVDL